ncbi:MAG: FmdE family protein [Dissulfurispiraceae bacterium]
MPASRRNLFDVESLLLDSAAVHGHLCPGQVLGVRMAVLGLSEIGIEEPKETEKNLIVFIEMDRCAADAIQSVTGCTLGRRTMKFLDYGKMAATFVNLKTGRAVRIVAKEDARIKGKECFPEINNKYMAQLEAYKIMPVDELFDTMSVVVELKPEDMPGRPSKRIKCARCGEYVQDAREVIKHGCILCRPCAGGSYYKTATDRSNADFFSADVVQKSHNGMEIRSKLWIEVAGEPVFGRGRRTLLHAIEQYGSISRAAKQINISYRRAWSYLKAMEERLGIRLVERRAGGKNGGGAFLTEDAEIFLKKYEQMEEGIKEMVDERFNSIFRGLK